MKPFEYLDSLPLTVAEREKLTKECYRTPGQLLFAIKEDGEHFVAWFGRDNRSELLPLLEKLSSSPASDTAAPLQQPQKQSPLPEKQSPPRTEGQQFKSELGEFFGQFMVFIVMLIFFCWFVGGSCAVIHY